MGGGKLDLELALSLFGGSSLQFYSSACSLKKMTSGAEIIIGTTLYIY